MGKEVFIRPVHEFMSRPFDKAASRLAYELAYWAPYVVFMRHSLTTAEAMVGMRPAGHLGLAVLEVAATWVLGYGVRKQIVKEAARHHFILGQSRDQVIDKNQKPPSDPPSGGGAA